MTKMVDYNIKSLCSFCNDTEDLFLNLSITKAMPVFHFLCQILYVKRKAIDCHIAFFAERERRELFNQTAKNA
jgi:hypothetical protein